MTNRSSSHATDYPPPFGPRRRFHPGSRKLEELRLTHELAFERACEQIPAGTEATAPMLHAIEAALDAGIAIGITIALESDNIGCAWPR